MARFILAAALVFTGMLMLDSIFTPLPVGPVPHRPDCSSAWPQLSPRGCVQE